MTDQNNTAAIASDETIERIAQMIANAHRVCVFTGAGASAESGVETFRGSSGLWTGLIGKIVLGYFGTPLGWSISPKICWTQYVKRFYEPIAQARPNPGHYALAKLQKHVFPSLQIITQNVDGLHQRAGSDPDTTYEVHGTVRRHCCVSERHPFDFEQYKREHPEEYHESDLNNDSQRSLHEGNNDAGGGGTSTVEISEEESSSLNPHEIHPIEKLPYKSPNCQYPGCKSTLRPDCVLFTEGLPVDQWNRSYDAVRRMREGDVMLVIGTSAKVYPAAGLPSVAAKRGAYIIEFNIEETDYNTLPNYHFVKGPSGVTLPRIVDRVIELRKNDHSQLLPPPPTSIHEQILAQEREEEEH
ncbi:hypothetical protein C9374_014007 [Naegleria lovaniensis]|uniref:Deacetylase sirtuin-type domain-containing protein n=1 Tax=Naegleria lovaniensis TaxID=51637 RepID=A0AA88GYJ4_NAELO|nr:uncharacterized protein C9374_014007 [Naegleria lovaniensis]KAG2389447.1 hypothetical protein C9374_014007 [Naegleria lovaniensis]